MRLIEIDHHATVEIWPGRRLFLGNPDGMSLITLPKSAMSVSLSNSKTGFIYFGTAARSTVQISGSRARPGRHREVRSRSGCRDRTDTRHMTVLAANRWDTLPERFLSKVNVSPGGGCWEWTAGLSVSGYGRFRVGSMKDGSRRNPGAHVVAYTHCVGPVPEGLELDHLCRNPRCVRPDHLEPVTHRENMMRGHTVAARSAAATHCPQGHPYDEANTRQKSDGSRGCRVCSLASMKRHYASLGNTECPDCGRSVSKHNLKKHRQRHERGMS